MKTKIYVADVSSLNDNDIYSALYNKMPQYRKEKIDRLNYKQDKLLSLGVGALLKKACCDFNISDFDEKVIVDEWGKPSFLSADYHFNLSHSNNLAMCVISTNPVGCDVEKVVNSHDKIIKKVFTDNEINWLSCQKEDAFYRLWTLKESYLKYVGKGFSANPLSVEITIDKNKVFVNGDTDCYFYENKIEDYYFACSMQTETTQFNFVDLINI